MIENNNFPWYLQQSSAFLALYTGFFDIAVDATPLALGNAFNIDEMQGAMLHRIGEYFGMATSAYTWDGLIYNMDAWSDGKNWTGGIRQLGEDFYSKIIKAKMYAYGHQYCLETLYNVFEIVFEGVEHNVRIIEQGMCADGTMDMGYVVDAVEETLNLGNISNDVDNIIDCGDVVVEDVAENNIIIDITAPENTVRAFIEALSFDYMFIGKPVGIKVNWNYNYL